MPLFFYGQKCPLCGAPMTEEGRIFSTWGVFFPDDDPIWRYCDAPLHWDCYAAWPERARFAGGYFAMWIEGSKHNQCWGTLLLDDDVLVTVNPGTAVGEVCLVLAATGTRYFVKLADWPAFATSGPESFPHPLEAEAFGAILARLQALGLDSGTFGGRAVYPPPPPPDLEAQAERRRIRAYNRAARSAADAATRSGLACPHCGADRRDHRFCDKSSARAPSFFVCASCARSFSHAR
jgi:hypothetical protein